MLELSVPAGISTAEAAFTLDGKAQPALNSALLSCIVEENTAGLYRCEARFGNWKSQGSSMDYAYFDRRTLDFGKEVTVTMGEIGAETAGSQGAELFRGHISALEGHFLAGQSPQIVLLAEDAAQKLRVTRRTRTFEAMSDAQVFASIAREHGLQAALDISGPTHNVIAQLNQSDLAFMRERARRLGAEIWVAGGKLFVQSRSRRVQNDGQNSNDLMLQYGRGLMEMSVIADTANQYTEVLVSGWDVYAKETLKHSATATILSAELNGSESGAAIVQAAFGPRTDRIAQQVPRTSEETQNLAEATFRAQARRFITATALARGDNRIRVGRTLRIQGIGALFSGEYYVTETRHIFTRAPGGGYTTEFTLERAGIGKA